MACDNLYVKRDNNSELTREILNFIDSAILDVKKFSGRKLNIFALSSSELKKNETKEALRSRQVRRLPALFISQLGVTIHGVDKIKEFYFKLTQAHIEIHRQQAEKDRELISGEDQFDQLFKHEANTTGQDGQNDTAATSGIGAGSGGGLGDEDGGDDLDLGSAYRDRLKSRGGGGPPASKSRNPALGGCESAMTDNVLPSMGPVGGPGGVGGGECSVMDSVRRSVAKTGGKDSDLELAFYQNMLEETKT